MLYLFGLDARPARGQVGSRQQLAQVAQRMDDQERLALVPEPKPGRLPLNIAGIRAGILSFLADFEGFLEVQRGRKKALQEASFLRNQAIKDHRRVYVNIARVQEGWYRLAGLDELADRLRAFTRGRKSKNVTEPARAVLGTGAVLGARSGDGFDSRAAGRSGSTHAARVTEHLT